MTITIIETGYVGLVQAAMFAEADHEVLYTDTDAAKIANLEQRVIPIYKPNLVSIGSLSF